MNNTRNMLKRLFDILFSATVLFFAAVPIFALWLLARWRLGSPVFFRQERAGKGARPFTIVKFRTMTDRRDDAGNLLPDAERLTRFGNFLRRTSLDELPEFWNVLRGDMSIVGPRPLPVRYTERLTPEQARRFSTPQGITGWTAVNGRNALSWEEKFRLDTWYADNRSFCLDMKILALTVLKVLRRENISARGEATAPEFNGTQKNKENGSAE